MEENKLAVHICSGCEIGDALDLDALNQIPDYPCKISECLCSEAGVASIQEDITNGSAGVILAACSPRFKSDVFQFECTFVERVNLREHVVWSHEPDDEDTQMMAEDYLRMGIARTERAALPDPYESEVEKSLLVIGGGLAGLSSAQHAAKAGYRVTLIEKEDELGGMRRKFTRLFSVTPPYGVLKTADVSPEVDAVGSNERITVKTSSMIEKISGQPGQFAVSVRSNGNVEQFMVGAIIQATGWKPYDANKLEHLGYGSSADVITNVEMEELLGKGKPRRPSDNQPVRSIAFIQCAGSRDENHLPYCSAVCCRVTMKQAIYVNELDPSVRSIVFYKDIRTPGQYEDLYRTAQESGSVLFTKAEVAGVHSNGIGRLRVEADDTLLGKNIEVEVDLVVLATGMVPTAADGESIRSYRDAKAIVEEGAAGAKLESAQKTIDEVEPFVGESILNLNYRQGPDAPVLKHSFPDSHFICFPYESRRTGIYMAGAMRAPCDSDSCRNDAAGAALKAIQSIELATQGKAVHPRWEDMSYPNFSLQRCTQCKRCTEECPFGVLNEDEKGTPQPNPNRCRRCGICMGACPERVVSFKDYSVDIVSSMIKAVEIPDEFDEKPRLLGLICENDAYPALDTAGLQRIQHSAFIRFIPVRCLGSVNIVWIADALSRGFDGILLVGCKSGDDYQCHFIRGSELMITRNSNVRDKLKQLALEEERVRLEELSISEFARLPEIINDFAEEIDNIGLNPFKGF